MERQSFQKGGGASTVLAVLVTITQGFTALRIINLKSLDQDTHICLLSLCSLIATATWNLVIVTHKSWPHVSCVFQASLATKGNWIWACMQTYQFPLQPAECVCLKDIEETVFFFWVQTEFPHPDEHFCFWQMERGCGKEEGMQLWEKRLKRESRDTETKLNWGRERGALSTGKENSRREWPTAKKVSIHRAPERAGRNWLRGTVCNTYASSISQRRKELLI